MSGGRMRIITFYVDNLSTITFNNRKLRPNQPELTEFKLELQSSICQPEKLQFSFATTPKLQFLNKLFSTIMTFFNMSR